MPPTRDLENERMAYSNLVGREVPSSSEEWKHVCEVAYLADLTPQKRKAILYGVRGAVRKAMRRAGSSITAVTADGAAGQRG